MYKRECQTCGAPFETTARNKKYCSFECYPSNFGKAKTEEKREVNIVKVLPEQTEEDITQIVDEVTEEMPEASNETPNDPVKHPSHYTRGTIETKDFIRDHGHNFNRGSAIKYIDRAGFKDPSKEVEDLQKAIQFLQFEIEWLTKENSHEH